MVVYRHHSKKKDNPSLVKISKDVPGSLCTQHDGCLILGYPYFFSLDELQKGLYSKANSAGYHNNFLDNLLVFSNHLARQGISDQNNALILRALLNIEISGTKENPTYSISPFNLYGNEVLHIFAQLSLVSAAIKVPVICEVNEVKLCVSPGTSTTDIAKTFWEETHRRREEYLKSDDYSEERRRTSEQIEKDKADMLQVMNDMPCVFKHHEDKSAEDQYTRHLEWISRFVRCADSGNASFNEEQVIQTLESAGYRTGEYVGCQRSDFIYNPSIYAHYIMGQVLDGLHGGTVELPGKEPYSYKGVHPVLQLGAERYQEYLDLNAKLVQREQLASPNVSFRTTNNSSAGIPTNYAEYSIC